MIQILLKIYTKMIVFYYDHPERFGIAAKYVFEDTNLLGTPVSNLEMLF